MTVAATTNRKTYTGDNVTTSFATSPVIFYATSDLQVRVTVIATGVSTLLTLNTHYTVSGGSSAGAVGTVSLAGGSSPHGALLSTEKLVILRVLPLTQGVDFVNNNNSDAEVIEAAFDKLTDVDQQLSERQDRALTFPEGDVSGSTTTLPTANARAGTMLGFDALGVLTTLIVTAGTTLVNFASSVGSSLIGFIQAGVGAVLRTVQAKLRDVVSVKDFGAVGDGVTDDTAAFAAVALIGGRIYLPKPSVSYLITDTVLFAQHATNVYGDGQRSTIIKFAPTTTGKAAFHFKLAAASSITQCSLRGVTFDATGNTQGTKSAVRVTDGEEIIIDDVAVSTWTSAAKDCIGLQFRGRQTHSISNVTVFADIPVSIEDNPNSTIDIDHYHFWNCYLCAESNSNPIIKIATGVNLSNVTIDGYQPWVLGTHGLQWVDTTTAQISNNLAIKNVRWEQSTNAAGYMIDIEHNTNLQCCLIENCYGGLNTLGIKLRKCPQTTIRSTMILTASGNALDVTSTVQPLILDNFFSQAGSTISVGTLVKVYSSGRSVQGGTSDFFVIYALPASIGAAHSDIPLMGSPVTIAQDAAAVIGVAAEQLGFLFVVTEEDLTAIYVLKGGSNGTAEVSDVTGSFTVTKDSAASFNIYYEAPSYKIQNKRGTGSHVVQWLLLGDNI